MQPDSSLVRAGIDGMTTSRAHRSAGTVIAARDGARLIGLASCATGRVHRARRWLTVDVAPDRRREGIGTTMVGALADVARDPRPFAGKTVRGTEQHAFARALGAVPYQICPPATVDPLLWLPRATPPEIVVVAGDALAFECVLEAWVDMYEWVHASWSPIVSRRAVREVFEPDLRANLDQAASSFALRADRIVAGSWLFHPVAPGMAPEAVAECRSADEPCGRAVLAAALTAAFADAARAGTRSIVFDCHRTDPHFFPLLREMAGVSGVQTELLELAV